MRRLIRLLAATALVVSGAGVMVAAGAVPAFAISCPNGPYSSARGQGFDWETSSPSWDVSGIRSGIKWPGDGAICDHGGGNSSGMNIWIGINGANPSTGRPDSNHLVQAGLVDNYKPGTGDEEFCKFWTDPAEGLMVVPWDCTFNSPNHPQGMSDGDNLDISIHQINSNSQYQIYKCGVDAADWTGCSAIGGQTNAFTYPYGTAFSEQDYEDTCNSGTNCASGTCDGHVFGSSSNQEKIGDPTGMLPLQGVDYTSGNWTARYWGDSDSYALYEPDGTYANPCSDPPIHFYLKESNPTRGLDFYDTRNTP